MVFKIILDANVILDLILKRPKDYSDLNMIYQGIIQHTFQGFITASIVHTCGYWLAKAYNVAHAKKALIGLLNDVLIIEVPHSVIEDALYSDMKDIEDLLQYYAAIHHKIDIFITRDVGFLKASKPILPVLHPREFVRQYLHNK